MKEYINKAALVVEIERMKSVQLSIFSKGVNEKDCYDALTCISVYNEILSFIDTLEVKEVKESSAADRGMAEEVIVNLRRIEQDYHIDLTKEMEWVRSKVQKGE